jgi:GNAT superfamily N-acetyltransferase
MIQIQKAGVSDAEGILYVHKTTWLSTYPNKDEGVTQEDIAHKVATFTKEGWEKRLEPSSSKQILVAKNKASVVGFAVGTKEVEEQNKIGALYVVDEFQHLGIGSQLMNELLKWLGDAHDCYTNVVAYNKSAIAFYEKHGFTYFRDDREDEWLQFPSGNIMKGIHMIRRHTT